MWSFCTAIVIDMKAAPALRLGQLSVVDVQINPAAKNCPAWSDSCLFRPHRGQLRATFFERPLSRIGVSVLNGGCGL